jgi:DNA-binding transcriptional LysR family regulator
MSVNDRRFALTPEALELIDLIARRGSFAAAARELGKVPSALTYNVRQLEQSLDVLLFDRRYRSARLTAAGQELLNESRRVLTQIDAIANRVRRVATGWETELSIAVDQMVESGVMLELVHAFYHQQVSWSRPKPSGGQASEGFGAPPTRLRLAQEVLNGTWEALMSGKADLAIGLVPNQAPLPDIEVTPLGVLQVVLAVAPHHPLATASEPIDPETVASHRMVVIADTAQRMPSLSRGVQSGQEVLTVADLRTKVRAQMLGLGCGHLPLSLVEPLQAAGKLVGRPAAGTVLVEMVYGWRRSAAKGKALAWWLQQLERPQTRAALLTHRAAGYL